MELRAAGERPVLEGTDAEDERQRPREAGHRVVSSEPEGAAQAEYPQLGATTRLHTGAHMRRAVFNPVRDPWSPASTP